MDSLHPFSPSRAVTLRELAAFMRMRPRELRALLVMLIDHHAFPTPVPLTTVFHPIALNEWFATQAGWVAGEYASTAASGDSDPFLARIRRRSENAPARPDHQKT